MIWLYVFSRISCKILIFSGQGFYCFFTCISILVPVVFTNGKLMTTQIIIVLILTFLINLITTLSYSVRIVGIRTGRVAISFALFNILVLVSRTANGFQAPLLAKTVENDIRA